MEAADRRAVAAQEVHARPQRRLDVVEVEGALGVVGARPVLAGADQAEAAPGSHPDDVAVALDLERRRVVDLVGLGGRQPVAHAAPVAVLADRVAEPLGQRRDPVRVAAVAPGLTSRAL